MAVGKGSKGTRIAVIPAINIPSQTHADPYSYEGLIVVQTVPLRTTITNKNANQQVTFRTVSAPIGNRTIAQPLHSLSPWLTWSNRRAAKGRAELWPIMACTGAQARICAWRPAVAWRRGRKSRCPRTGRALRAESARPKAACPTSGVLERGEQNAAGRRADDAVQESQFGDHAAFNDWKKRSRAKEWRCYTWIERLSGRFCKCSVSNMDEVFSRHRLNKRDQRLLEISSLIYQAGKH
jgi:hypothetical protein